MPAPKRTRKFWTDQERDLLKKLYPYNYTADLCKVFNRTASSINGQVTKLDLHKSPEFRKWELAKQAARLKVAGAKFRFNQGNEPANKGHQMKPETYAKVKRTFFKKGQHPVNAKWDGYERIAKDGYIEVRIRPGKFMPKHRYIWEQANGPVPPDKILVFKDGNQKNITLDNLELITRKENMLRNSIYRFPPELVSTIKLVSKLKRKINEKQN